MAVSSSLFSQLVTFKGAVKPASVAANFLRRISGRTNNVCLYSTASTAEAVETTPSHGQKEPKKMSKAMLAYLERAKAHDEFMQNEKIEYNIGKRHLANIMGEDPEHFTQEDVQRAIEYLFPSGLFEKKARPIMKPPEEMFPPRKAAEFDETGRPNHTMFYTRKPNYYQLLFDIVEQMENCNVAEDAMIAKGLPPDPNIQIFSSSWDWLSKKELEKLILEELTDRQYEYFVNTIKKIAEHPYSYLVQDFLMKYKNERKAVVTSLDIPPLECDSDGRPFITVLGCLRKSARGSVTLRGNGTGKITINGELMINYFPNLQEREQIIFPLHFTGLMGEIDVEATITGGGPTGQSGATRWGIAWGLRSFVDIDMVEKMRIAGLLTKDWRKRERKKPGQEGARRKFTWKKR